MQIQVGMTFLTSIENLQELGCYTRDSSLGEDQGHDINVIH